MLPKSKEAFQIGLRVVSIVSDWNDSTCHNPG